MKKLLLIFTLILSIFSVGNFAMAADEVTDDAAMAAPFNLPINERQKILEAINKFNDEQSASNEKFKRWIPLQVAIPLPNCMEVKNVMCLKGNIVAVHNVADFIVSLFQFGVITIGIFSTLWLVIGGVQYLGSGGDTGRAQEALDKVKNAFMSLIVILLSFTILYQIDPKLTDISINPEIVKGGSDIIIECFDSEKLPCGESYENTFISKTISKQSCIGSKCGADEYCFKLPKVTTEPAPGSPPVKSATCIKRLEEGKTCTSHSQCISSFCLNSTCNKPPVGKNCTSINDCGGLKCETLFSDSCSFGRTGADCDNDQQCTDGYFCWNFGIPNAAECVKRTAAIFQVCSSDSHCATGLECDNFVCVPNNSSSVCSTTNDCKSLIPNLEKNNSSKVSCIDLAGNGSNICTSGLTGSPCENSSHCLSGHCRYTAAADLIQYYSNAANPVNVLKSLFGIAENDDLTRLQNLGVCTDGLIGDFCGDQTECKSGLFCTKQNICATKSNYFN